MNRTLDDFLGGVGEPAGLSVEAVVFSLVLALVLGQAVAWVYTRTHRSLSYSQNFVQAMPMLCVTVALVMSVIGNSVARAFGLMGALAIIRFRTVVRDARDTAFLFFSLGAGIAAGSQNVLVAVAGTAVFGLAAFAMHYTGFGGRHTANALLRFQLPRDGGLDRALDRTLRRYCRSSSLVTLQERGQDEMVEYAYQVRLIDPSLRTRLLADMRELHGIEGVFLLAQDESTQA